MPFLPATGRRSSRLLATAVAFAATAVTVSAALAGPASAMTAATGPAATTSSAAGGAQSSHHGNAVTLASTISLIAADDCSATLVRYPTSRSKDPALMLTNGHCWEEVFIMPGVVLTDLPSSRSGDIYDADGQTVGQVHTDRLLYATMTGTDIALYRLTQTYSEIQHATGLKPLTISGTHPVDGRDISIPSGYSKIVYSCQINGFADTVHEAIWTWRDSIRYDPTSNCQLVGGTSGSPLVDNKSGKVVGINNTANVDGLQDCEINNPCEVQPDGSTKAYQGEGYGQETYWITTCLDHNVLDLNKAGCLLPKPQA